LSVVLKTVEETNKNGDPNSASMIPTQLKEKHDITRSPRTVLRILHALGLY